MAAVANTTPQEGPKGRMPAPLGWAQMVEAYYMARRAAERSDLTDAETDLAVDHWRLAYNRVAEYRAGSLAELQQKLLVLFDYDQDYATDSILMSDAPLADVYRDLARLAAALTAEAL